MTKWIPIIGVVIILWSHYAGDTPHTLVSSSGVALFIFWIIYQLACECTLLVFIIYKAIMIFI